MLHADCLQRKHLVHYRFRNDGNLRHQCVTTTGTVPVIFLPLEINVRLHNILAFACESALTFLVTAVQHLLLTWIEFHLCMCMCICIIK